MNPYSSPPITLACPPTSDITEKGIFNATKAFCENFVHDRNPVELANRFTCNGTAITHGMHGMTVLHGRRLAAREYFYLLFAVLRITNTVFSDIAISKENMSAYISGSTKAEWTTVGRFWNETFVYKLSFELKSGVYKIKEFEAWGDSGAGECPPSTEAEER